MCGPLLVLPWEDQMGRGWWITRKLMTKIIFNHNIKVHLHVSGEMLSIPGMTFLEESTLSTVTPVFCGIWFGFSLPLQSNKMSALLSSTLPSHPLVLVAFLTVASYVHIYMHKYISRFSIQRRNCTPGHDVKSLSNTFLLHLSLHISIAKEADGLGI